MIGYLLRLTEVEFEDEIVLGGSRSHSFAATQCWARKHLPPTPDQTPTHPLTRIHAPTTPAFRCEATASPRSSSARWRLLVCCFHYPPCFFPRLRLRPGCIACPSHVFRGAPALVASAHNDTWCYAEETELVLSTCAASRAFTAVVAAAFALHA